MVLTGPATSPQHTTRYYPYSKQLKRLAARRLESGPPLPRHTMDIVSPVSISFWWEHLGHHPNRQFSKLILSGLDSGFPIGLEATSKLRSANANLISARDHPQVVSQCIQEELQL